MDIDVAIKDKLKADRLAELKRRYYNLQLDFTALEAVGDIQRATEINQIMLDVQKAYEAIANIDTGV